MPRIRLLLVSFWALWTSVVALTNLGDALKQLEILPPGWSLASTNFALVEGSIGIHGLGHGTAWLLFAGVIAWQVAISWLLWTSLAPLKAGDLAPVERAFLLSLGLWCAFLVVDELLIGYVIESTHLRLLVAQLVTLLVVRSGKGSSAT